jgi:hypothetical protein
MYILLIFFVLLRKSDILLMNFYLFRLVFFQIQLIIEIIVIKKVSININRRGNNIKIKI